MPEPLFKESFRPGSCNFIKKETLAQLFSCDFCEISKNTFSYRAPPLAASDSHKGILIRPHDNYRFTNDKTKFSSWEVFRGTSGRLIICTLKVL